MKLKLADGRTYTLPDDTDESEVVRIGRDLTGTQLADATTDETNALKMELAAVQAKMDVLTAAPRDAGVVEAINMLRADLAAGVARIVKAQTADRVLVRDETGEPVASRIVR